MKSEQHGLKYQIETELLSNIGKKHDSLRAWVVLLTLICAAGVGAWIWQLREGLGVTAMRDYVSWGVYISLLFFFVGISLIGALVSSALRFSNAKWRFPLMRIAEAVTLSSVFFAALMPVLDMGRPERLYFLLTHGRLQSPILWDVVAIATYFFGSLLFFYLPLIPDLALMRDRLTDAPPRRRRLIKFFAANWTGSEAQHKVLDKGIRIMSVLILPVAVSVHTISAWLIAMTLRPGWNTSIMGPYFVFGALMAGCAIMILIMSVLRKNYHLEHYIGHSHFSKMAMLLLALTCVYLYLNLNKYGVPAYVMKSEEKAVLEDLLTGNHSLMFWAVQIGGLALPIVLLSFSRVRHSIRGVVWVSGLVLAGALLNRYLIVVPNLMHPFLPIQNPEPGYATYFPTWVEWTMTAASLGGFVLLVLLLFKPFPVVTIWETALETEKNGVNAVGLENLPEKKQASPKKRIFKTLTIAMLVSALAQASAQDEKIVGNILLNTAENDSMHTVTALVTDAQTQAPLPDVEVGFYLKRTFGLMSIGDATTDSTGIVSAEFPIDMPGSDTLGNIFVLARVEDSDVMYDTTFQTRLQSKVSFPARTPLGRGMIASRAPLWLVLAFTLTVGAVWGLMAYVLSLVWRLKKLK